MKKIIIFLLLQLWINALFSQTWNLPNSRNNTRFTSDYFDLPRPALSLRGFDNQNLGSYNNPQSNQIKGVKQLIKDIYNLSTGHNNEVAMQRHIDIANSHNYTSGDKFDINSDASILESRALLALVSFIIDNNNSQGEVLTGKSSILSDQIQDHSFYLNRLMADFRSRRQFVKGHTLGSAFKIGTSLTRLARAWDLYLALENAYEDLGGNTSQLLSSSDKYYWNKYIIEETEYMKDRVRANFNQDITQAGNWPLIAWVSIATVSYGFNGFDQWLVNNSGIDTNSPLNDLQTARIRSSLSFQTSLETVRKHNWYYQTGGGQAFWAEGPYYLEVLLPPLLNFLHIYKSNDLGRKGFSIGTPDPHFDSRLLNALEWHYNIATNDGNTPPLDDGNLKAILSSRLMNWSDEYGNSTIGKKYAFIKGLYANSKKFNNEFFYDSRLVEISYNHVSEALAIPHSDYYGNTSATETSKQQTVIRKKDANGTQHYILMNGERGEAISHGEGHEQVDQMQLLYYIKQPNEGEFSALMDTGYDEGGAFTNSAWNKYNLHNVLHYSNVGGHKEYRGGDGSYMGPYLVVSEKRKVSEHPDIDHLYYKSGKVTSLIGQFPIRHYQDLITSTVLYNSKYKRETLIIESDQDMNTPTYLIDTNADESMPLDLSSTNKMANSIGIKYFSDVEQNELNSVPANNDAFMKVGNSTNPLWIFLDAIEADMPSQAYNYEHNFTLREVGGENYAASYLGMKFGNEHSASWTSLAIINAQSGTRPIAPIRQVDYASNNYTRTYQVYSYEHSPTIVDIVVRRAKPSYLVPINTIELSLSNFSHLRFDLPADKDLGFVRLKKVGNLWEHVDDYTYNVEPKTTVLTGELFLTSNQTLDGNILIDGEEGFVTVHGATLTIAPGSRVVFVGDRVALTTSNGGKIIADGVSFINQNSSDNGVSIYDSGSQFTNCSFEGFSTGLGINSNGVLIDQCLFKNNTRAISVSSGRVAAIYNSTFENNTYGVYALGTVLLDGMGSTYTTGNVFKQNTYGIYAFSNGNIFTENGLYESNTTAAIAKFSGVFGVGKYELGNSFRLNTNLMTNESSFTIDASRQYHLGMVPPDIENVITFRPVIDLDPTNPSNTDYLCGLDVPPRQADEAICPDADGGGGTIPDPTVPIAKSRNASDDPTYQVSLQQLNQLLSALYEKPEQLDLEEAMLATFMQFVKHYDQDLQKQSEQFAGFLQYVANQKEPEYLLKKWNLSITNEQQLLASQLYLKLLLLDNQVDQVLRIIDKEARKAQSTTHSLSYLGIKLDIYLRLEDFDQALLIVDQMEALTGKAESRHFASKQVSGTNSESTGEEATASEDWTFIRDHITALRGISKGQTATKSRVTKEAQEPLITHFVLHPSYPNPFNPVTTISFELPEAAMVTVEVFNMTGQLVATLTNQRYTKGQHSLLFDASNRSTGVYLVRAVMGTQVSTQKITLMK